MATKVLVIDDDVALTGVVRSALEGAGYEVEVARDGLEGLQRMYRWQPDLVILDVMMPRMDGWETCRRIREVSDIPVVMLTARGEESQELKGLHHGADLYMAKPVTISLLLARVEALLRRSRLPGATTTTTLSVGDLKIDLARYEVTLADRPIALSPTEFRLLAALAAKAGQVVQHRELLTQVWGPEYADEDLYLKLYIRYLRQKIEEEPGHPQRIITKRGVGYCLQM